MPGMHVGTDIIIYCDTKSIINSGVKLHQSAGGASERDHQCSRT